MNKQEKQAFDQMREVVLSVEGMVSNCDVSSGVCCCGDSMNNHPNPMYCGHSPVDSGVYAADSLLKKAREAITAANAVSEQAQGEAARLWCETCEGGGTVDNTLGGDNINATSHDKCPDCDGHGYFVSSIYRDQPQASKLAWLPIETAPEDGYMLVYEDEAIRALFRYKGKWQKIGYPAIVCTPYGDALVGEDAKRILPSGCTLEIRDGCCENPTHWMPIPSPPEAP